MHPAASARVPCSSALLLVLTFAAGSCSTSKKTGSATGTAHTTTGGTGWSTGPGSSGEATETSSDATKGASTTATGTTAGTGASSATAAGTATETGAMPPKPNFQTYGATAPVYPVGGPCWDPWIDAIPSLLPPEHTPIPEGHALLLSSLQLSFDASAFAGTNLFDRHQVDIDIEGAPSWPYVWPNWLSFPAGHWSVYTFPFDPPLLVVPEPAVVRLVDGLFCSVWDEADGVADVPPRFDPDRDGDADPLLVTWEVTYAVVPLPDLPSTYLEWFRYPGVSWGWPTPDGTQEFGSIRDLWEGVGYDQPVTAWMDYFYSTLPQDVWIGVPGVDLHGGMGINALGPPQDTVNVLDPPVTAAAPGRPYLRWGTQADGRTFGVVFGCRDTCP